MFCAWTVCIRCIASFNLGILLNSLGKQPKPSYLDLQSKCYLPIVIESTQVTGLEEVVSSASCFSISCQIHL